MTLLWVRARSAIQGAKLSAVIRRNTRIVNIQDNAFIFSTAFVGTVFGDANGDGIQQSSEAGVGGAIVTVRDETGTVVGSATSASNGTYAVRGQFDPATFTLRVAAPVNSNWAASADRLAAITKGGDVVMSVGLRRSTSPSYQSYDGTGNNVAYPSWGAVGSQLLRLSPVGYADGKSSPAGATRKSARAISNIACVDVPEGTMSRCGFRVQRDLHHTQCHHQDGVGV